MHRQKIFPPKFWNVDSIIWKKVKRVRLNSVRGGLDITKCVGLLYGRLEFESQLGTPEEALWASTKIVCAQIMKLNKKSGSMPPTKYLK
jgi:hypothetical protein